MNILAFDLGTTSGWAAQSEVGFTSGTLSLKPNRYEGGGMRYLRFRRHAVELMDMVRPDVVYYEEVRRHMGVDAAHIYGGLLSALTMLCEERSIPYQGVPVGTIKKHWTGKGNAKKDAMIAEALRRGFTPKDDNEADAIALLTWGIEQG